MSKQEFSEHKQSTAKHSFADVERFISETAVGAEHAVVNYRRTAFHRFPILFGVLGIVGGVVTVFGLERVLMDIGFFSRHPILTVILGLCILGFTGALYKRLS